MAFGPSEIEKGVSMLFGKLKRKLKIITLKKIINYQTKIQKKKEKLLKNEQAKNLKLIEIGLNVCLCVLVFRSRLESSGFEFWTRNHPEQSSVSIKSAAKMK